MDRVNIFKCVSPAFSGCACEQLYVSWQNPAEIRVLPYHECTLFVPKGTKEKYLSSPSWSRFSKIEEY